VPAMAGCNGCSGGGLEQAAACADTVVFDPHAVQRIRCGDTLAAEVV
jgi:hypothetical protein